MEVPSAVGQLSAWSAKGPGLGDVRLSITGVSMAALDQVTRGVNVTEQRNRRTEPWAPYHLEMQERWRRNLERRLKGQPVR